MERENRGIVGGSALILSIAFLWLFVGEARAELYGFQAISNNSGVSDAVAGQFSVEVTAYPGDPSRTLFRFANDAVAPHGGRIMRIFFEDTDHLGDISGLIEPSDLSVDFLHPAKGKGNLPGLKEFVTTDWIRFNKGQNKIDPGEYLGVVYSLAPGKTLENVIDAMDSGSLQIGIHVGSIAALPGKNDSDTFKTSLVPVPGAALLGLLGISSAGLCLRRKKDLVSR